MTVVGAERRTARRFDRASIWPTIVAAWVATRVVVGVGYLIANSGPLRGMRTSTVMLDRGLILWDGTYYRDLVQQGYEPFDSSVQRFFPGYHVVGRVVSWLVGGHEVAGLLVVSNVAAFAAMCLLHELVFDTTGDRSLARRSVWWLALFPASGVLVFGYGESLSLVLALGALVAIRRNRLAVAGALGVGLGLCRPTAVLFVVPLLGALWPQLRGLGTGTGRPRAVAALAVLGAPVVGVGSYLLWLQIRFGSWEPPIEAQRGYRAGWHEPLSRLVRGVVDVAGGDFNDVFNVGFALAVLVALAIAARRVPPAWSGYVVVTLLVTLAANNIDSLGRYAISACTLPVVLATADLRVTANRPWLGYVLLAGSAALSGVFVVAAWTGTMIP